jgi:hypothetical protein
VASYAAAGTLSIAGGVQVLPARDECVEAFQWLAQEIRTTNGEAAVIHITQFEGLTDQQVVAMFCAARVEDYRHIETHIADLKQTLANGKGMDVSQTRDALARLRRRHDDIARIDYFECQKGKLVASLLDAVERSLSPAASTDPAVSHAEVAQYRDKRWVTRPRPHVDRLACAWLIRRFINPQATIRYSSCGNRDEIAFDMKHGEFGHLGNLCTFETMKLAFGLEDPGLQPIAEIVHEIDLHDGRYARPEVAGIETLLEGWAMAGLPDVELESKGESLFEGLYAGFSRRLETGK